MKKSVAFTTQNPNTSATNVATLFNVFTPLLAFSSKAQGFTKLVVS
jgi:hypothetical protein